MRPSLFGILSILVALGSGSVQAQTGTPHKEIRRVESRLEGEPFLLKELGAVCAMEAGAVEVITVMPPGQRPAAYKDVDLLQDDLIVMANGRHVAAAEDLQSMYDSLAVGGTFKLGIKRGQGMHLVSLSKGNPKDLPQLQMKVVHGGDGGDMETFPAVGVAIRMKGRTLVIDELLPGESPIRKLDVKTGDIIASVNGRPVSSLKEYEDVFDHLAPGKDVTWSLVRGESRHSVTFSKPKPRMIIRREGTGK